MCHYSETCPCYFCLHTCIAELHQRLAHLDGGSACPWYPARPTQPWQDAPAQCPPSPGPSAMDWEPTRPEVPGEQPQVPIDQQPSHASSTDRRVLPTRGCMACAEWAHFTGDMYRAFTLMQRNGAFLEGISRSGLTEVWRIKAVIEALRYCGIPDGLFANPLAQSSLPRGAGGDSPGTATDSTRSGGGYNSRGSDGSWGEGRGRLTAAERMWRY